MKDSPELRAKVRSDMKDSPELREKARSDMRVPSRIMRESAEAMSLCATKCENVITEGIYGRYVRNRERSREEISEE